MRDIVIGKLVDHTIDDDYEELSERLFGDGNCFNASEVRKRMYGMKAIIEAIERDGEAEIQDEDMISLLDSKRIELQKERQKFFDQRNAYNKLLRERSRQEELNEILVDAVRSGNLPSLQYVRSDTPCSDNDLLVSLNDIHYGANVQNYWNTYNSDVCRDMMCKYLDRIISIGETHKSENCIVWANGDEISGNIHQSIAVTNKENVIEQIKGVSELIAEFLAELSKHFRQVVFVSVAGNHSRIEANKDRALISERLDDLVEWYLSARLQNFDNIVIGGGEKIDHTIYLIDVRGKTYCGVHGDFDGSSGKVQSLQAMAGRPVYAVLSGHLHHNKTDEVQGVKTVMAGSFLGMDDYCVQKRIVGRAEQMVCVCDESGIRCAYGIPLQ
nr:MAG TPA: DNA polymerase II small subunit [Caudoviricetes sp.]